MLYSSILSILALAASVHAHGYVSILVADGKKYVGGVPGETHPDSPIRLVSTINPYKDPKGAGQTCGLNAKAAKLTAPLTAGSTMQLSWAEHKQQAWPHELGPLITYMAKVPAGKTAATVDPATLDYFKIQQTGQKSKGSLKWVVEDQMKLNTMYNVAIPKNIPDGDYIMRHEIIALHLADKVGGAEFYASCFQVTVSGGTGSGSPGPTVKHPGAYTANDKGIYTPKVFDSGFIYSFPGPALFSGASSSNSTTPSTASASASGTKSVKPTSTKTASSVADPEPTETDDDCTDEEPTATESAPVPTATDDDCTDEDPETSSAASSTKSSTKTATSKHSVPTDHNGYKRAGAWSKRMEKRYVGVRSS